MSTKQLIETATEFEQTHKSLITKSEKILAVRKAKELVLEINKVYKETKDEALMDLMKKITAVKRKFDKKLYGKLI